MRVPKGEGRENETEKTFGILAEIMSESSLNSIKDMTLNIHEVQQNLTKKNSKKITSRHFQIRLSKDKILRLAKRSN